MGNLSGLLNTALAIVAIGTLAGLGLVRSTVTNLREQLADARGEIKSLKEGRDEDRAKITQQAGDIEALTRVVTGEVHWKALGEQLDGQQHQLNEHHREATEHWLKDESLLVEIRDAMRRLENSLK